jgi:hypothetical protein
MKLKFFVEEDLNVDRGDFATRKRSATGSKVEEIAVRIEETKNWHLRRQGCCGILTGKK